MAEQTTAPAHDDSHGLSADHALNIAWWTWFALLSLPFIIFILTIWRLVYFEDHGHDEKLAQKWFIASMVYMMLAIPAAFFWRGRLFRGYWSGQLVQPRDYLVGMITVWASIEIGGLLALAGCLVTGTMLPNLLPALLAFMLFTPLWPNGHSMTRALINEHDPADYEDPR
jgi:hypothetical protein